jgi:virginiamycin B lyase
MNQHEFTKEIRMSRKSVCLSVFLVLFCWAGVVVPASAQHFQQIPGSLTQVAAGRTEVWGLNASHQVYRFIPGTKQFVKISGSLTQIAVGGGALLQADEVWGVNASGGIYRFTFSSMTLVQVPGVLSQIVVGEGDFDRCHPYEVWGINPNLLVYRYDYCSGQFHQSPTAPALTHIATGGGDLWGLDEFAQIWHYSFQQLQWNQIPGSLQQITVGVNDVFGLDGNGNVYRFDASNGQFASVSLGGAMATQIAAGGNGVWAIYTSGQPDLIARFDPNIEEFAQVSGALVQIAVGSGGGVWGVNSSNHVYVFVRP